MKIVHRSEQSERRQETVQGEIHGWRQAERTSSAKTEVPRDMQLQSASLGASNLKIHLGLMFIEVASYQYIC